MRRPLGLALTGLFLLASVSTTPAQWEDVSIVPEELAPGIYMLTGRGGNMGLCVGEDGVLLIDDQFAPLTDRILAAVREISTRNIGFLINTHWHGDHTGGNENMGNAGVAIVAHDNVRARMSVENFNPLWDRTTPPSPEAALPVITFAEELSFFLNGEEIEAVDFDNAHTDGDAVVWFRTANIVHMGDIFFNGMYPFIDVFSEGSIDGVIAAVETVLERTNGTTRFIPGHGPVADREDLDGYLSMLRGVRRNVAEALAAGRTLEETQGATAEWDEVWGGGFMNPEVFTRLVYESLGGDPGE